MSCCVCAESTVLSAPFDSSSQCGNAWMFYTTMAGVGSSTNRSLLVKNKPSSPCPLDFKIEEITLGRIHLNPGDVSRLVPPLDEFATKQCPCCKRVHSQFPLVSPEMVAAGTSSDENGDIVDSQLNDSVVDFLLVAAQQRRSVDFDSSRVSVVNSFFFTGLVSVVAKLAGLFTIPPPVRALGPSQRAATSRGHWWKQTVVLHARKDDVAGAFASAPSSRAVVDAMRSVGRWQRSVPLFDVPLLEIPVCWSHHWMLLCVVNLPHRVEHAVTNLLLCAARNHVFAAHCEVDMGTGDVDAAAATLAGNFAAADADAVDVHSGSDSDAEANYTYSDAPSAPPNPSHTADSEVITPENSAPIRVAKLKYQSFLDPSAVAALQEKTPATTVSFSTKSAGAPTSTTSDVDTSRPTARRRGCPTSTTSDVDTSRPTARRRKGGKPAESLPVPPPSSLDLDARRRVFGIPKSTLLVSPSNAGNPVAAAKKRRAEVVKDHAFDQMDVSPSPKRRTDASGDSLFETLDMAPGESPAANSSGWRSSGVSVTPKSNKFYRDHITKPITGGGPRPTSSQTNVLDSDEDEVRRRSLSAKANPRRPRVSAAAAAAVPVSNINRPGSAGRSQFLSSALSANIEPACITSGSDEDTPPLSSATASVPKYMPRCKLPLPTPAVSCTASQHLSSASSTLTSSASSASDDSSEEVTSPESESKAPTGAQTSAAGPKARKTGPRTRVRLVNRKRLSSMANICRTPKAAEATTSKPSPQLTSLDELPASMIVLYDSLSGSRAEQATAILIGFLLRRFAFEWRAKCTQYFRFITSKLAGANSSSSGVSDESSTEDSTVSSSSSSSSSSTSVPSHGASSIPVPPPSSLHAARVNKLLSKVSSSPEHATSNEFSAEMCSSIDMADIPTHLRVMHAVCCVFGLAAANPNSGVSHALINVFLPAALLGWPAPVPQATKAPASRPGPTRLFALPKESLWTETRVKAARQGIRKVLHPSVLAKPANSLWNLDPLSVVPLPGPKQTNGSDCGVFVVHLAEILALPPLVSVLCSLPKPRCVSALPLHLFRDIYSLPCKAKVPCHKCDPDERKLQTDIVKNANKWACTLPEDSPHPWLSSTVSTPEKGKKGTLAASDKDVGSPAIKWLQQDHIMERRLFSIALISHMCVNSGQSGAPPMMPLLAHFATVVEARLRAAKVFPVDPFTHCSSRSPPADCAALPTNLCCRLGYAIPTDVPLLSSQDVNEVATMLSLAFMSPPCGTNATNLTDTDMFLENIWAPKCPWKVLSSQTTLKFFPSTDSKNPRDAVSKATDSKHPRDAASKAPMRSSSCAPSTLIDLQQEEDVCKSSSPRKTTVASIDTISSSDDASTSHSSSHSPVEVLCSATFLPPSHSSSRSPSPEVEFVQATPRKSIVCDRAAANSVSPLSPSRRRKHPLRSHASSSKMHNSTRDAVCVEERHREAEEIMNTDSDVDKDFNDFSPISALMPVLRDAPRNAPGDRSHRPLKFLPAPPESPPSAPICVSPKRSALQPISSSPCTFVEGDEVSIGSDDALPSASHFVAARFSPGSSSVERKSRHVAATAARPIPRSVRKRTTGSHPVQPVFRKPSPHLRDSKRPRSSSQRLNQGPRIAVRGR